jgi:hypothetical protein
MINPKAPFVVINPATGLPMIDGNIHGVDQAGFPFGVGSESPPTLMDEWSDQSTLDFGSSLEAFD